MTRKLVVGRNGDKVNHLLELMTRHRVRHLPIMDGDTLLGLVSIGDLVKAQIDQIATENLQLKEYIQGGAVAP
jgi:CBS domain-containing protein